MTHEEAVFLAECLMVRFRALESGYPVSARWLHGVMEAKQPFALWAHAVIVSVHGWDNGAEYTAVKGDFMLTNDSATVVAMRGRSLVSAVLQVRAARAMSAFVDKPENAHLRSFPAMMEEAKASASEDARLKRLFASK